MPALLPMKNRVILTIWSSVLVLTAYLGWVLLQERSILLDRGRSDAISLSQLVAESANMSFRLVDVSLHHAIGSLPPLEWDKINALSDAGRLAIENHLKGYQQTMPGVISMSITDHRGIVFANTVGAPPGANLGDQQYFRALREGDGVTPAISEAIRGRVSGKWGVQIARRIDLVDGRFAGVLVANLGIEEYFGTFFNSLRLMEGTTISLWNQERRMLVRYPATPDPTGNGKNTSPSDLGELLHPGRPDAVSILPSPVDGKQSLAAMHPLRNYPIYAIVTLNEADYLAPWRKNLLLTFLIAMALVAAAAVVTRQLSHNRRTEEWLRLTASVFTHSHEGIMITDAESRIIDINHPMEQLTGYSRSELIGKTPAMLDSGHHDLKFFSEVKKSLLETGSWRGDIWNRRKNGELYVQHTRISAVHDDRGSIRHFVGMASDITDIKEERSNLEKMAFHDPLTDLPNRILLADRLQQAITSCRRDNTLLAVCYVDLDNFKPVNDTYGHSVGDQLLAHVANRWRGCIRGGDTVARLGGDEFVILLSGMLSVPECEAAVARLLDAISMPFTHGDIVVNMSASIGVAICPRDGTVGDDLLKRADLMLYHAKNAGRSCYRFSS